MEAKNYKKIYKESSPYNQFNHLPRRQTTWEIKYGQQGLNSINDYINKFSQEPIQEPEPVLYKKEKVKPDFVKGFLKIIVQIRLYHWQTVSYAEHQALGNYYDSMSDLIDIFVESYQGKYSERISLRSSKFTPDIQLQDYTMEDMHKYISEVKDFIQCIQDDIQDSQLDNILDEMKSETDKLVYLLTFR